MPVGGGEVTIEIWSGEGLDDGKAKEKVAWRDPAFRDDISGMGRGSDWHNAGDCVGRILTPSEAESRPDLLRI